MSQNPSIENGAVWELAVGSSDNNSEVMTFSGKITFSGRQPSVEDYFCWRMTFSGKMTFSGRRPLVEDDHGWKIETMLKRSQQSLKVV